MLLGIPNNDRHSSDRSRPAAHRLNRARLGRSLVAGMALAVGLAIAGCSPPPGTSTATPAATNAAQVPVETAPSTTAADPEPAEPEPTEPTDLSAFCAAVREINKIPDSDKMTPAEREQAIATIDHLLALWPAETSRSAEIYFGWIRDILKAGEVVDLENTTPELQEAFAIVFQYVADTCPEGFG